MVDELSIGPCMAVELALKGNDKECECPDKRVNPVEFFRQCVGPPDPVSCKYCCFKKLLFFV